MNTDRLIMVDPLDVHARLRKLGLRASDLTDAMLAGASAMTTCMENHPPIYSGLKFWAETVRALRDRKLEDGWNRDDSGNYSTVVNAGRTIQIAVARGDEWTGRAEAPSGRPSTRHPKGVATQRVVEANQLSLFDPVPVPDNDQGRRTVDYMGASALPRPTRAPVRVIDSHGNYPARFCRGMERADYH